MKLIPVILAGGLGTRLWPLSRELYPKQFIKFDSQFSFFQKTLLRLNSIANLEQPLIIINEAHYFLCLEQLAEISIHDARLIVEPVANGTATAIAIAALYIQEMVGAGAIMLVLPSDHLIIDNAVFNKTVNYAATIAQDDYLITFGIKPSAPKTEYGYIEADELVGKDIYKLRRFIEKPEFEMACQFIEQENFYWNSGIFMFSPQNYLNELKALSSDIYQISQEIYEISEHQEAYLHINKHLFSTCPNSSIDYAVMEKTSKGVVIPLNLDWKDLGCWSSIAEEGNTDDKNNLILGKVMAEKTENSLIYAEEQLVATLGLKNTVVVCTDDAVLVADKSYVHEVKQLVTKLKVVDNNLTKNHRKVYRPWGYYKELAVGLNFRVKFIMVKPGAKLSLQLHKKRAEHWIILSGIAEIINGSKVIRLSANQSTYIPMQTQHRLSNIGKEPLCIIEIQTGNYLGEDDIVRLEDIYGRYPNKNPSTDSKS